MNNSAIEGLRLSDRDLIEAIIGSFYILDYGYITKVNSDKTINVNHCTRLVTRTGEVMPVTVTKNIEVLTLSGKGISINFDYAAGDKVLLLGLKNLVKNTKNANQADDAKVFYHYTRETMKAIPLCAFNGDAKVKIEAENGTLKVKSDKKIELNGNSKQFVTWAELNTALTQFITQLNLAMTTTPIIGNGSPQATWAGLPSSIDISAAKTTTVVTGG